MDNKDSKESKESKESEKAKPLRKHSELSGVDNLFLRFEEEDHIMNISSFWTLESKLELKETITEFEAIMDKYPRFGQKVVLSAKGDGLYQWAEDPVFDLSKHVHEIHLEKTRDDNEVANVVGKLMSTRLEKDKPLWDAHIIQGHQNGGSLLIIRMHHCITDGQGAVRASFALTKSKGDKPQQYGKIEKADQPRPEKPSLLSRIIFFPFQVVWFIFALLGIAYNMALIGIRQRKYFVGEMDKEKAVSWNNKVSLIDVKTIKNAFNCTVNDVMIATLAGTFRKHLLSDNPKLLENDLVLGVPVSLRGHDEWQLANRSTIVCIWLPLSYEDPMKRLAEVKRRMSKMKESPEPRVQYFGNQVLGQFPRLVTKGFFRWSMSKMHAVFTNVPGPAEALYFANKKILSITPFIPQSGEGGLGIALFTYDNKVSFSVLCDASRIKGGPRVLTDEFEKEFQVYLNLANAAAKKD